MLWPAALTASLLLASHAHAGNDDVYIKNRREEAAEGNMRRYTSTIVQPVERRQAASNTSINATQWDTRTEAACITALTMLNGVTTNPSGQAVCYNIPFLDNSTGVFQADLRLFTIGAATGGFAGVPTQDVVVSLQYLGATVSTIKPSDITPRSIKFSLTSWPSIRRGASKEKRAAPVLAQSYAFIGRINKNLLSANFNSSSLQSILIPIVSLTARTATGGTANTTLSSDEATFVIGQFSDQPRTTMTGEDAAAVIASAPFVLPGTQILIFPIGAIVTGVWAFLGIATVSYGTLGRLQFRHNYRKRVARAERAWQARI